LDFEKAFDRIEWGFLFSALAKLGFSDTWVRWVKLLYHAASSAIKVNGVISPDFQLSRSMRQGCPLGPYLFILATDVLGHMLADPRHGVEGLSLPRGGFIRYQTFVDDTTLYLRSSPPIWIEPRECLKHSARPPEQKLTSTKLSQFGPARRKWPGIGAQK
jgi:hypothetical protein